MKLVNWIVLSSLITLSSTTAQAANSDRDFADLSGDVKAYLKLSRELRSLDEDSVAKLVDYTCGIDVDKSKDEANKEAKRIAKVITDKVQDNYDDLMDLQDELNERIEDYLADSNYEDAAEKLETVMAKDKKTLKRFEDKTKPVRLYGANNPKIRASMAYGVRMHGVLEGTEKCLLTEVKISISGSDRRADCMRFDLRKNLCSVIEFKPSTYKKYKRGRNAKKQVNAYVNALKRGSGISSKTKQFLAANCAIRDDKGKITGYNVTGSIETYPACK